MPDLRNQLSKIRVNRVTEERKQREEIRSTSSSVEIIKEIEVSEEIVEEIRASMEAQKQEIKNQEPPPSPLAMGHVPPNTGMITPGASPTPADSGAGVEEVEEEAEEGELMSQPNLPPRQLPASPETGKCTSQEKSPPRQFLASPESGECFSSSGDDNNVNRVTPFLRKHNNNHQKSGERMRSRGPNEFPNVQERDLDRPLTPPSPIYQDTEQDLEAPRPSYTKCEYGRMVEIHETAPPRRLSPTAGESAHEAPRDGKHEDL